MVMVRNWQCKGLKSNLILRVRRARVVDVNALLVELACLCTWRFAASSHWQLGARYFFSRQFIQLVGPGV